jgi:DNA-binding GntR family transcriptional regulator
LQTDGWVDFYPNRGCYVLEVSEEDLDEIYALRALLEPYAAARAANRVTPAQIEHLQELFRNFVDTTKAGNYREAPCADLKLHKAIWEISGSQRMFRFLCSMEAQILRFLVLHVQMYEALVEFASYDHQEILDAIRGGNARDASLLMERHIRNSAEMVRDFKKKLRNSPK